MRIESVRKGASGSATFAAGGSSFFAAFRYLSALGLEPESLVPGLELDEAAAEALSLAAEATEAERRALGLLARAEQCRAGLEQKLARRELGRRAVALALDRLAEEGLLDDRRYAEAWLRTRLARAEGPSRLLLSLRAKGIGEEAARAALNEVLGPEERGSVLAKAARRELERAEGDRDRAASALRAQGFKSAEIRAHFDGLED